MRCRNFAPSRLTAWEAAINDMAWVVTRGCGRDRGIAAGSGKVRATRPHELRRMARPGLLRFEKSGGDHRPFRRKFTLCWLPSRPAIPIAGIVEVTLDAVQIGMDPGAFGSVIVHD